MSLALLILCAAILNFIPYLWSSVAWFFVFFSLTPILYVIAAYPASFRVGLAWGFCVAWLHCGVPLSCACSAFFSVGVVTQMAILAWVALYMGLHAGLFFWCADYLYRRVCGWGCSGQKYHMLLRLVFFSGAISFFLIWFSDYCFWIGGRPEGFIFAHALIPFGQHTECMQQLVYYLNFHATIVLLVLLQAAVVCACITRTKLSVMLLLICAAPWVWSLATSHNDYFLPAWHERVVYAPRIYFGDALQAAQRLHNDVVEVSRTTKRDIVLMPEAVICGCTHQALEAVRMMPPALHVIMGVCCSEGESRYNAVIYIHDTEVVYRFDKRFLALFTECAPRLCGCDFGQCSTFYNQGTKVRQPLVIDASIRLVPYICSELFYQQAAEDAFTDLPLLALCGDTWVAGSYVQKVFLLGATIRALQWQRDIVYVSSSYGAFISKWGKRVALEPCMPLSSNA